MKRAVGAELRTMSHTWSLVAVLAGAVIETMLSVLVSTVHRLIDVLHAETIVLTLFLLIAAVIASAGEYQHRTVQWTLLGTPDRRTAAAAKLIAVAVIGVILAAAVLAATWITATIKQGNLHVGVAVGTLIIGQLVLGALTACFGLGLGMALRSLPGGITAVFALALVLPLIFQAKASLNGLARILPYGELSAAALALGSSPANSGPQLATAAAGVLLLAWTTSVCVIALARFLREDI